MNKELKFSLQSIFTYMVISFLIGVILGFMQGMGLLIAANVIPILSIICTIILPFISMLILRRILKANLRGLNAGKYLLFTFITFAVINTLSVALTGSAASASYKLGYISGASVTMAIVFWISLLIAQKTLKPSKHEHSH